MLFSVIIPVYKVESFLPHCLDSLLAQTFSDFEIILVDDGSPDSSPAICDSYAQADSRIKVIHKENGGVNSARHIGVSKAEGEYLVFVDSDDFVSESYLEAFYKLIQSHHPDILCCGHCIATEKESYANPPTDRIGFYDREAIQKEIFPYLIEDASCRYFMPTLWAKAFRRELYLPEQLPLSLPIKIGEDGACVVPCVYRASSLYITESCLYYYRVNEASAVNAKRSFPWEDVAMKRAHLQSRLDMKEADFAEQLDRLTVHALFNAAASRFNSESPYREIAKEIKAQLDKEEYASAIARCRFTGKKGKLALFALKHKLTFLIKLYNRMHWK